MNGIHQSQSQQRQIQGISTGGGGQQQQDDFTSAILISFGMMPAGIQDQDQAALREAALKYCSDIENSPNGWQLCLTKFHSLCLSSGSDAEKFFCLNVIFRVSRYRYNGNSSMPFTPEEKNTLRTAMMVLVRDILPGYIQSSPIKTKLASILVVILRADYPHSWPTFFSDFLSLVNLSIEVIDLFIRILKLVDEDVVSFDQYRQREEVVRNTALKDAMKEKDLSAIVEFIFQLISSPLADSNQLLITSTLWVLAEYIGWIDVSLIVNDRFLKLFYSLIGQFCQQQGPPAEIAAASVHCLNELCEKKMDGNRKIQLIQSCKLLEMIHAAPLHAMQEGVAKEFAGLIATIGAEMLKLLNIKEKAPRTPHSNTSPEFTSLATMNAFGGQMHNRSGSLGNSLSSSSSSSSLHAAASSSTLVEAANVLDGILSQSYRLFDHPVYLICLPFCPFYSEYLSLFKSISNSSSMLQPASNSPKLTASVTAFTFGPTLSNSSASSSASSLLSPQTASSSSSSSSIVSVLAPAFIDNHSKRLFSFIRRFTPYPPQFKISSFDDDNMKPFLEFREQLLTLFQNLATKLPEAVMDYMRQDLNDILSSLNTRLEYDVESMCTLIDKAGESLRGLATNASESGRAVITMILSTQQIASHSNPIVSCNYFRLANRFGKFFEKNPAILPDVLRCFFDQRGIGNSDPNICRVAVEQLKQLLGRMNDSLRKTLGPLVDEALKSFMTLLEPLLSMSRNSGPAPVNSIFRGHPAAPSSSSSYFIASSFTGALTVEDIKVICECLAIFISSSVTGDGFKRYFSAVLGFFESQLATALNNRTAWANAAAVDIERIALKLSGLVAAIASLTKPMSSHRSKDAQEVSNLWDSTLKSIGGVLVIFPQHDEVRKQVIFFTHQMIECLGNGFIPFAGPLLEVLNSKAKPENLSAVLELANECIVKFRGNFFSTIEALFTPLVLKIKECMQTFTVPENSLAQVSSSSQANQVAYGTERSERSNLLKLYFNLLNRIVTCDLAGVLTSEKNSAQFDEVCQNLLSVCQDPAHMDESDVKNMAAAFQIIRGLLSAWANNADMLAHIRNDARLKNLLLSVFCEKMFVCFFSSHLNVQQAHVNSLIKDLMVFQRELLRAFENDAVVALQKYFQSAGLSADVVNQYGSKLTATPVDPKLFDWVISLLTARQQQITNNQHQQQQYAYGTANSNGGILTNGGGVFGNGMYNYGHSQR